MSDDNTKPANPAFRAPVGCAWPDRVGFWWVRHQWGMELMESFLHGDPEEDESEFAVIAHNGGTAEPERFFPRDLEPAPVFVWLGERFPHNEMSDPA